MIHSTLTDRHRRRLSAGRRTLTALGIATAFSLFIPVQASTYRVYTSSTPAMSLNANDGYCSLAEAIQHVNGNRVYGCQDFDPASTQHRIELLQSAGKPYGSYPYKVTTLTISSSKRVTIAGYGAFIESTGYSAFVIKAGAQAFFERLTLTNTAGIGGGRLLENYGTLQLYGVIIARGDVTGNHHATGRGGGIFNAGSIPFAQNIQIKDNKARKGGGIYNDAGNINGLSGTITGNSATQAGGGIFNVSTTPAPGPLTNGIINDAYLTITGNSARAGGGIFNRGEIDLTSSWIMHNTANGSGSQESCTGSQNCDGSGGGVLNVHLSGGATRFGLAGGGISHNVASRRGGAVYNVGVLNLAGVDLSSNVAQDGAAIYVVSPTDGTGEYCNISGDNGNTTGPTVINENRATNGYSIVAGGPLVQQRRCVFSGLRNRYVTASGNSGPNYCQPLTVDTENSRCPQP